MTKNMFSRNKNKMKTKIKDNKKELIKYMEETQNQSFEETHVRINQM